MSRWGDLNHYFVDQVWEKEVIHETLKITGPVIFVMIIESVLRLKASFRTIILCFGVFIISDLIMKVIHVLHSLETTKHI